MEKMVNIYLYGKKYEVPSSLTIMNAMEYAGYQLVRGVGCRCGFCGACATIYRIKGQQELKMKCGVGKCGRCNIGSKYVCKDGPVFRFDQLDALPSEY